MLGFKLSLFYLPGKGASNRTFSGLAINIFMTYLKLLNYGKIKTTTILNLDKSILMVPVASESLMHTGVIRIVYNILYCIHHQYLTRKYGDKK